MTPNLQFGWSPLHYLRSTRYKLIKAPRPELYDLSVDPEETTNVFARHPEVARDLMGKLDRLIAETARGAPTPEQADLDKKTLESLAALGYIGAPAASRKSATSPPRRAERPGPHAPRRRIRGSEEPRRRPASVSRPGSRPEGAGLAADG